ncbi:MAG TPA: single-stranded DNA-binding protein [Gaiellaceae bacterium]|nr:single-stranded DNA-binding protein [Gaiellaceae bacterium]
MAGDINRVTIVGRLTRDPELRQLPSGSSVLQLGVAVNGRQRDDAGNWSDKPNFFDVKVFGNQAEMLANHLSKGRRVGVDGRLDWSSWEATDGTKRSKVEIVAQSVQFLDSRGDGESTSGANQFVPAGATQGADADFSGADDDIPF